jgi:hypothetical protein
MRSSSTQTKRWTVYVETMYEHEEGCEPRVGGPVLFLDGSGRPLVACVTEVHDESDTLLAKFYNQP